MPFDRPGLLQPPEVYAAVAYVLNLNGIIEEDGVMDATSLPKVKMPNRDGFVGRFPARMSDKNAAAMNEGRLLRNSTPRTRII